MTEQKVKKRGWVKNAAIIFLAVMLVLTFFSNTIMNRSLPEVAAQGVQSGTISAKIRGTGTVTANESFEVKSDQTREILSVPVQVGQEVKVGDILINYSDAESDQIKQTQDELDALVLAYKKALVNASDPDYAKENRDIELAQAALDKAKAERDAYTKVTAADVAAAQENYNEATLNVNAQKAKVEELQNEFDGLSPGTDNSAAVIAKTDEINTAKQNLKAAELAYETGYNNLVKCAAAWKADINGQENDSVYIDALAQKYSDLIAEKTFPDSKPDDIPEFPSDIVYSEGTVTAMVDAYNAVHPLESQIDALNSDLEELYNSSGGDWNYTSVKKALKAANDELSTLQTRQSSCETILSDLKQGKTDYEAAETAVETDQKNLEDLMFSLAEQKKTDGKTQQSEALDLADQKRQIEEKEEDLSELKKGGEGASVESQVNGIVASINASAGNTAQADDVLMTIEVPDMGYGISISVTADQSKKVAKGDTADVSNYWSSDPITATLVAIKNDPQNPMTNKILFFKLQGDVESGTQLSISIGEKGGNYETIVPNSAIREDNNGKFVLAVESKSSPLGNRYIATRIDVKVLSSDDVNSAVSGGLSSGDFVITTSSKPVEPGTQVRLADNA